MKDTANENHSSDEIAKHSIQNVKSPLDAIVELNYEDSSDE